MPFSATGSVIDTDMNNIVRGVWRDNTTRALTGTLAETTMAGAQGQELSITGGTLTATGGFHIVTAGIISGAGGTKRIRLYLASLTVLIDTTALAGTSDWFMDAWVFNTATNAQRCIVQWSDHSNSTNYNKDYLTQSVDTTNSFTIGVTGVLAVATDTITRTMMEVQIVQIA